MYLLIFLAFIISPQNQEIFQTDQITFYSDQLNSGNVSSDELWGATILYQHLDNEKREKFSSELNSDTFTSNFDESSSLNSMLNISFAFEDEHLLLSYLLNQASKDQRLNTVDRFYQNSSSTALKELNYTVASEKVVNIEALGLEEYPFALFLISHHFATLNVTDRSFYTNLISLLENSFKSNSPLSEEFKIASLFNAYETLDRFDDIVKLYPSLKEFKLFPFSYDKRDLFWSLDYVLYQTGHINLSLEVQRNFTIPLTEYLGDRSGLNAIYSSHGGYLYMIGKYRQARQVFQNALEWSENLSDQNLTRLYNNLSLVYFTTGESSRYVETQLKALEHAESYENYDHQINIYRNLHIFYRKNQNYELSRTYIEQAASLAESVGNKDDLISILISRYVFESEYLENGNDAEIYLEMAEEFLSEDLSSRHRVRILSERAQVLKNNGKYVESIEIQNKVKELAIAQNNTALYLEKLVQLSELYFLDNQYAESSRMLRDFKTHDISVVEFSVLTLSKMLEANLLHHNGEHKKADRLFSETVDAVLERARYSADHETGYWTVESEYMELFESYTDFLIEREMYSEAVELLDRVKTINDASMLQNPLITSNQLSEEDLTRDRQITQEMETLRRQAFGATGDKRLQLNNRLERLQAQKRELHRHRHSFAGDRETYPIWSVQRSLSRGQVLMHVTHINSNYYIAKITSSSISIEKLEIGESEQELFESAIEGMIGGRTDLQKLYQVGRLIGIDKLSSSVNSIIMMPDGYLHQLPLAVIPMKEPDTQFSYGSTTYLIEKIDVRHLNHLAELFERNGRQREFENDFSGFGVADFQNETTGRTLMTLPKAPGEVTAISGNLSRFPKRSAFIEASATPDEFRRSAGKSRILHMATHSEISESDPLFSRLHLVPDQNGPESVNQIFAYELFDLDLQNELIMLNSCESGGDRAIQGSGIMGISRALHYAGAQSLILNAWSVNDQYAADFAEKFYQFINDGESKSRALQLTKIEFIKNRNANPHFWGPYILNGDNRPLIQKRGTHLANWLVALIFIAGFILVSRTRQCA